jgi:putative heme-binding domain-containing protein
MLLWFDCSIRKGLLNGAIACLSLLGLFAQPATVDEQTAIQIEALSRLKDVDLEANTALKAAVLKVLEKTRGTPQFMEIVRDFKLKGHGAALLEYALKFPAESSGIEAFRLAVAEMGRPAIESLITTKDGPFLVQLMGNSNDKDLQPVLRRLVRDSSQPIAARKEAVRALARKEDGARFLLDLATKDEVPADVKLIASSELNVAPWPEIKKMALEILPLPQTKNAESLPPISELIKRNGDADRGRKIFESQTAACSSCHQVNGRGTEVGPNLSEIGTKLGKEALFESILDPSAGISFGFEAWSVEFKNGDEAFGLITSETADEVAIKSQAGVLTKIKKVEITRRRKMVSSLMPTGLQLTMSSQDLVDLVEYLVSLKKAKDSPP